MNEVMPKNKPANTPIVTTRKGLVKVKMWENLNKDGKSYTTFTVENSYQNKETQKYEKKSSFSYMELQFLKGCIEKMLMDGVTLEE